MSGKLPTHLVLPLLGGIGLGSLLYSRAVTAIPMSPGGSGVELLWLFPPAWLYLIACIACCSFLIALNVTLVLFLRKRQRANGTVCSERRAALVFLPFSLGIFTTAVWNGWLVGLNMFVPMLLHEGWLTLLLVSIAGSLVQLWSCLGEGPWWKHTIAKVVAGYRWLMLQRFRVVLIFAVSFSVYRIAFPLMPGLNGDEPHYLLIMHSIVHDGDLDINNNYVDKDYRDFMPGTLNRHVTIGHDGTRYSTHPVGLAFMGAIPYALGGVRGVMLFLIFCAAVLSTQLFLIIERVAKGSAWTVPIWAAVSFSAPLLPYSVKVFPELPAAMLVAIIYRRYHRDEPPGRAETYYLGACCSLLPWLQQRFIIFAFLLLIAIISRHFRRRWVRIVELMVLPGLSMAGLGLFYYALYRNPLPSAPYASVHMDSIWSWSIFLKQGLGGLLFDQEYGVMLYSPLLLLIPAGLLIKARVDRIGSLLWLLLFLSIYVPAGGFTLKWFGSWAPMGRYMVILMPLFVEAIAHLFATSLRHSLRWVLWFLLWITAGFTWILLHRYDLWTGTEIGRSKLLGLLSDILDLPLYFPTFITPTPFTTIVFIVWLAILSYLTWFVLNARLTDATRVMTSREPHGYHESTTPLRPYFSFISALLLIGLLMSTTIEAMAPARDATTFPDIFRLFRSEHRGDPGQADTVGSGDPTDHRYPFYRYETNRVSRGDRGTPDFIVSGPYVTLPAGYYRVAFTIKLEASPDPSGEPIASFDVVSARGHILLARGSAGSDEFPDSTVATTFSVQFLLTETTANIETRVFSYRRVDFRLENIVISTSRNLHRVYRGHRLAEIGRIEAAIDEFSAIVEGDGLDTLKFKRLAELHERREAFEAAIGWWESYLRVMPEDREALHRLGNLLIRHGDRERGILLLQQLQNEQLGGMSDD